MTQKKVPLVHAEVIKAWADGATIQYFSERHNAWNDYSQGRVPQWVPTWKYRVKPEPKPDVVMYAWIHQCGGVAQACGRERRLPKIDNCMFVFDGETGALKDVQLLAKE